MLSSFSKVYESAFRIFFLIWVIIWTIINVLQLIFQYASFAYEYNSAAQDGSSFDIGQWWLNTIGTIIGLAIGIVLIFFSSNVPGRIKNKAQISGLGLWLTLAIVYYLFPTLTSLTGIALFRPEEFAFEIVFISLWLLPSIIIMIFHIIYFVNLSKYNSEIALNDSSNHRQTNPLA